MWISIYLLWFLLYSCFGWLFECTYNIIMTGKWENRGFLYGPVCPIYGCGAASITLVAQLYELNHALPSPAAVFAISFFGSIVLEYGTSWVLEKLFHAVWWDYSNMPFNVHGRICLPASLAFGITGVAVVYGSAPLLLQVTDCIPSLLLEAMGLIAMAVLASDVTLTVSALTDFAHRVDTAEQLLNARMEKLVDNLTDAPQTASGWLEAQRERITAQTMESAFDSMDETARGALRRIKALRPDVTRKGSRAELMRRAFTVARRAVAQRSEQLKEGLEHTSEAAARGLERASEAAARKLERSAAGMGIPEDGLKALEYAADGMPAPPRAAEKPAEEAAEAAGENAANAAPETETVTETAPETAETAESAETAEPAENADPAQPAENR